MTKQDIGKRVNALEAHAGDVDSAIDDLLSRVEKLEAFSHAGSNEDEAQRSREEYAALMLDVRARDPLELSQPPRSLPIERAVDDVVDEYEAKLRGEDAFVNFAALLPESVRRAA